VTAACALRGFRRQPSGAPAACLPAEMVGAHPTHSQPPPPLQLPLPLSSGIGSSIFFFHLNPSIENLSVERKKGISLVVKLGEKSRRGLRQ